MVSEANASIKLSELNKSIRSVVNKGFPDPVWVMAEISELKTNYSGHAYLELIEKDHKTEKTIAKARATIWSFTFRMLKPYFESSTGYLLEAGIKVLVKVSVEFHEVYGLSLNITDIDPTYTLGDIEKKRQEIISRLEKEGVFKMNKGTPMPIVPQKIAVVSSKTAAGFKDFINQLKNNDFSYVFYPVLFPAIMQGEQTEESIIKALDQVFQYEDFFDVVVIIRGGGSKSDLAAFDNYNIAYHITQFPIPVVTGIGHEQDETIADLVAHTHLKTPTAVAEYLLSRAEAFESKLIETRNELFKSVSSILGDYKSNVNILSQKISGSIQKVIQRQRDYILNVSDKLGTSTLRLVKDQGKTIDNLVGKLNGGVKSIVRLQSLHQTNLKNSLIAYYTGLVNTRNQHLTLLQQRIHDMDPERILDRGFSITHHHGKVLKDINSVQIGDNIETSFKDGRISSSVTDKNAKK